MKVIRSKRFQKKFERYFRAGRKDIVQTIHTVARLLMTYDHESIRILREKYRDHALKGSRKGIRELHLSHDDLLLYIVLKSEDLIIMQDIVTHEELRKKK